MTSNQGGKTAGTLVSKFLEIVPGKKTLWPNLQLHFWGSGTVSVIYTPNIHDTCYRLIRAIHHGYQCHPSRNIHYHLPRDISAIHSGLSILSTLSSVSVLSGLGYQSTNPRVSHDSPRIYEQQLAILFTLLVVVNISDSETATEDYEHNIKFEDVNFTHIGDILSLKLRTAENFGISLLG
uniref:Uncharacterized protein n=1 Tax=Timema bartmani TaxID=61472 RepID=A0A7R9F1U1_9NEOP|nr:unnamed protein product [Timema bartmani]